MQVTYTCPEGYTWKLCDDMLQQDHLLIAGTTGSGKSTLLHSLIFSAIIHSPVRAQFILIDLKGVELMDYKDLPHTICYADDPMQAINALSNAVRILKDRIEHMKRSRLKTYDGSDVYIIIDEMAVLMQTAKAKVLPLLAELMRLGRAARIHVISATQNPNRSSGGGCPSIISQNTTAAISLRTRSAIESRITVGIAGAEKLPKYGKGIYWNTDGTREVTIPMTPQEDINERINYWLRQKPRKEITTCRQSSLFTRLQRAFS